MENSYDESSYGHFRSYYIRKGSEIASAMPYLPPNKGAQRGRKAHMLHAQKLINDNPCTQQARTGRYIVVLTCGEGLVEAA